MPVGVSYGLIGEGSLSLSFGSCLACFGETNGWRGWGCGVMRRADGGSMGGTDDEGIDDLAKWESLRVLTVSTLMKELLAVVPALSPSLRSAPSHVDAHESKRRMPPTPNHGVLLLPPTFSQGEGGSRSAPLGCQGKKRPAASKSHVLFENPADSIPTFPPLKKGRVLLLPPVSFPSQCNRLLLPCSFTWGPLQCAHGAVR